MEHFLYGAGVLVTLNDLNRDELLEFEAGERHVGLQGADAFD